MNQHDFTKIHKKKKSVFPTSCDSACIPPLWDRSKGGGARQRDRGSPLRVGGSRPFHADRNGLNSTQDSLFHHSFVNVYPGSLKSVPWHAVLVNHDYGDVRQKIVFFNLYSDDTFG